MYPFALCVRTDSAYKTGKINLEGGIPGQRPGMLCSNLDLQKEDFHMPGATRVCEMQCDVSLGVADVVMVVAAWC